MQNFPLLKKEPARSENEGNQKPAADFNTERPTGKRPTSLTLGLLATASGATLAVIEIGHATYTTAGGQPTWYLIGFFVALQFGVWWVVRRQDRAIATLETELRDHRRDAALALEKQAQLFEATLKATIEEYENKISDLTNLSRHRKHVVCKTAHDLAHLTRNLMTEFLKQRYHLPPERTVGVMIAICDFIARAFSEMFDNNYTFGVAIKAFTSDNAVQTIARDKGSLARRPERMDANQRYLTAHNSAFLDLLSCEKTVFACDDLEALGDLYKNKSPDWLARYNKTMVVPIRRSWLDKDGTFEMVGFIGIHCKANPKARVFQDETGKSADDALRHFALFFADNLYAILKQGIVADAAEKPGPSGFVTDSQNFKYIGTLHDVYIRHQWTEIKEDALFR